MKKIVAFLMMICIAVSVIACGGGNQQTKAPTATGTDVPGKAAFRAGFGCVDITSNDPLPMAGYSDGRISGGYITPLEARCVAVQDENGEILVFVTADLSMIRRKFGTMVMEKMEETLGLSKERVILSGTHTHGSVDTENLKAANVANFNEMASDGMVEAARLAIEDLKPARVFVGTAITKDLNFVRRYFMDDGSLCSDQAEGTGSYIVSHETQADPELGMLKFAREGGKDILITNFQAHPHLEGRVSSLSAETVGAMRDAFEAGLDVHSLHWQGAAGNLNSRSRIAGETRTLDRKEYAQLMLGYAQEVYGNMTEVASGPIQVTSMVYTGTIDHSREHMLSDAYKVVAYFEAGHTSDECKPLAQSLGFNSYYQAYRVVWNHENGATLDAELIAWSFGDVAGIVTDYELFDTAGVFIKKRSPFAKTFIIGYAYPGTGSYIPTADGFERGGYERDSCRFVAGTLEEMSQHYVDLLVKLHN